VLDEADRLLETGNTQTILKLFSLFPKGSAGTTRLQVPTPSHTQSPFFGQQQIRMECGIAAIGLTHSDASMM